MEKISLNHSEVAFDEGAHTYTLHGKTLSGITAVIRAKLFPTEYDNVSQAVLDKAAERGHRVHSALEMWDTLGMPTDDCPELDNYIRLDAMHEFLRHHLASEYIVSDNERYASGIDKVYQDGEKSVVLADIKTVYSLNTEYVSWQLSVYAYLFSLLNPEVKVSGLYAIHLRGDKARVVEVGRKSDAQVRWLLYDEPIASDLDRAANAFPQILSAEARLISLKAAAERAAAEYEQVRQGILAIMEEYDVKHYESDRLVLTRKADTERTTFDTKRFRAEHPDLYAQYASTATAKGGILIKVREAQPTD